MLFWKTTRKRSFECWLRRLRRKLEKDESKEVMRVACYVADDLRQDAEESEMNLMNETESAETKILRQWYEMVRDGQRTMLM